MISHIMIRATYFHNNVFINMICAGQFRCSERCVTNVYKQHYRKYFKITQYFNIDHIKVTRLGFPVKIDKPCRHWMCIYIQYIYICSGDLFHMTCRFKTTQQLPALITYRYFYHKLVNLTQLQKSR